jgi:hypothetical protein
LDLLIQAMVFCKVACASFNNTSFMPTHKLVSLTRYWQTFDIMWPIHHPTKGFTSCKDK